MEKKYDRLVNYAKFKGLTLAKISRVAGISSGLLSKGAKETTDISDAVCLKISEFFTDLNKKWLLTGKGGMLLQPTTTQIAVGIAGDNQQLNNVQVSSETITSLVNTLNKIVEANSCDMMKKNEQIDRLIGIIETEQKKTANKPQSEIRIL